MPRLENSGSGGRRLRARLAAEGRWLVRTRPATATLTAPFACTFPPTCWRGDREGGGAEHRLGPTSQDSPPIPPSPASPFLSASPRRRFLIQPCSDLWPSEGIWLEGIPRGHGCHSVLREGQHRALSRFDRSQAEARRSTVRCGECSTPAGLVHPHVPGYCIPAWEAEPQPLKTRRPDPQESRASARVVQLRTTMERLSWAPQCLWTLDHRRFNTAVGGDVMWSQGGLKVPAAGCEHGKRGSGHHNWPPGGSPERPTPGTTWFYPRRFILDFWPWRLWDDTGALQVTGLTGCVLAAAGLWCAL